VGLEYLDLDRAAPTLSGGEAQRIRIAAQLGSNLQGVCYILDEPTIGLHPRSCPATYVGFWNSTVSRYSGCEGAAAGQA
jgi:excinuclease UvrABC ATPase subunit